MGFASGGFVKRTKSEPTRLALVLLFFYRLTVRNALTSYALPPHLGDRELCFTTTRLKWH